MAKKKFEVEVLTDNEEIEVKEEKKEVKTINLPEYYMTRVGETLKDVSKKFGISEDKLKELNNNPEVFGGNQIKLK